jgi:hypothetical protein
MSHDEAVEAAKGQLHLIGKKFRLKDGEIETIKTVVAWKENDDSWHPHVCFYDWEKDEDGRILHMNVDEFFRKYVPAE